MIAERILHKGQPGRKNIRNSRRRGFCLLIDQGGPSDESYRIICRIAITACVRRATVCAVESASVKRSKHWRASPRAEVASPSRIRLTGASCRSSLVLTAGRCSIRARGFTSNFLRCHTLSYALSSELNLYLQSLATLTSLRIGERHFASIDFPSNPCEWMSTNEANVGCWYPQLMEPLLADAPE
jgi:hypothetical protein